MCFLAFLSPSSISHSWAGPSFSSVSLSHAVVLVVQSIRCSLNTQRKSGLWIKEAQGSWKYLLKRKGSELGRGLWREWQPRALVEKHSEAWPQPRGEPAVTHSPCPPGARDRGLATLELHIYIFGLGLFPLSSLLPFSDSPSQFILFWGLILCKAPILVS